VAASTHSSSGAGAAYWNARGWMICEDIVAGDATYRRVCARLSWTSCRKFQGRSVAATKTLTRAPSLRDKHKNQTRRALRDAALKLFASQGYDATTTEEIAEKAGVSTRTFFRYFPTKEHVLYHGEHDWVQAFIDIYPTQPDSLDDLDAMRVTLESLASRLARSRRSMLLYQRAVDSSPTLRGHEQDHQLQDTEILARAIAERRGRSEPDQASTLLAAVTLLVYRRALDSWLAGPPAGSLAKAINKQFKLLIGVINR
jgi:AcrR family transcriptional regulator